MFSAIPCVSESFGWQFRNISSGDRLLKLGVKSWEETPFLQLLKAHTSLVVDVDERLCMLVCDLHYKGLTLNYLHAPIHPIDGFLSSVHSDRLATLVVSMRVARCAKAKHSSYEFRLLKSTGDNKGSHVMSLSKNRNMKLHGWETVHYASEMLAVKKRPDTKALAEQSVLDGVLCKEKFKQLADESYIDRIHIYQPVVTRPDVERGRQQLIWTVTFGPKKLHLFAPNELS